MSVSFANIIRGVSYSRPELARVWGYNGYQALARGVVTPRNDNKIILFVTEEKQAFQEQYQDRLTENDLHWEGPTDHFAEDRMANATSSGDEIHVFHRDRHHSDFTYIGQARIINVERLNEQPSHFHFNIF